VWSWLTEGPLAVHSAPRQLGCVWRVRRGARGPRADPDGAPIRRV